MHAIPTVAKMHIRDTRMWFVAPWLFEIAALLVSLLDGLLMHSRGIASPGVGDIYIFYFVVGIVCVNDTFPFALSYGVRRKD